MGSPAVMAIKIIGDAKDAQKAFSTVEKGVHNFSKKFGAAGPVVKAGLTAAIAAAPALAAATGKALYDIGSEFDEMADTIRVGTGATGKALDGLIDDAKAVGSRVPEDFSKIGPVVADLNTRLGISGETLQTVAGQVLEAGRMLGEDIDINAATGAFNAFHLEAEQIAPALDTVYRVSQDTGISMNRLTDEVAKGAPALQELGFNFDQSTALIGKLDKAGLDSTKTITAMGKGLVTLAKSGEEPAKAFQRVTGEISELVKKGDDAAALDLAGTLFGTRGAPQFLQAIKDGTFNIEDLTKAAQGSGDTIMQAAEDTADAAEAWQLLKNNAKLALEPLASAVFNAVGDALKAIADIVKDFSWEKFTAGLNAPEFAGFAGKAQAIWDAIQRVGNAISRLAQAIMPHIAPVLDWLQYAFAGAWQAVSALIDGALNIIEGIINTFTAALNGDWQGAWEGVKQIVSAAWDMILGVLRGAAQYAAGIIGALGTALGTILSNAWRTITALTSAAWNAISNAVSSGVSRAVSFVSSLPGRALAALGSLGSYLYNAGADLIRGFINGIASMASRVWDKVTAIASSATRAVKNALGIASPSRVFTQIGVQTGQGLIVGLNRMQAPAARAARDLVDVPRPARLERRDPATNHGRGEKIEIHLHGVIDKLSAAREIEALLRRYRRAGGVVTV